MFGGTLKAIDRDADYVVDYIKFPDRTNRGGDVDCRVGMESSNSRRNRVRGMSRMEDIVNNGARFDEHYVSFLLDLKEFVEERRINEDQNDPDYVMFLDNLKEWGNSYVLNKSISHGVTSRIVYEVETIPFFNKVINRGNGHFGGNDYAQRENSFARKIYQKHTRSRGISGTQKEKNAGKGKRTFLPTDCYIKEVSNSDSSEEEWIPFSQKHNYFTKMNGRRNLRSHVVNYTKEKRTPGKSMKRKKPSSSSDCYIVEVGNSDFCGKFMSDLKKSDFCNRVKKSDNEDVQEKRTVGEVIKRSKFGIESSDYWKRITEADSFDYFQEDKRTKKKTSISPSLDYLEKERRLNLKSGSKYDTESSGFRKRKTNPTFDYFQEDENTKKRKPVSRNSNYLHKKQNLGVIGDSKSAPKKSSDKDYDLFMKNLNVNGQSFIYENGENERVCYDLPHLQIDGPLAKDLTVSRKQPTTVATLLKHKRVVVLGIPSKAPLPPKIRVATQSQPTHPSTALVLALQPAIPPSVKQLDNNWTLAVAPRVGAKMRKKLHEILSKPYSKEEHDELWKTLSTRAAVQIHRDSRSGGSDRPGRMGHSLLDWYPDATLEIEKVKSDPHKVLNLLRMVSFYVQKLPCGNICKPWMDATIVSILPRSS